MTENETKEMIERMDKASFLLGLAWGFMKGNKETYQIHGLTEPDSFRQGYETFCSGVEELFYK